MLIDRDPPHYLQPLRSNSVPRRLMWLDCAAHPHRESGMWVHRWLAGALGTTHFTSRRKEQRDTMGSYDDARQLWESADAFCGGNRRVVLWAHDLAYQLRISQALVHLPALGWTVRRIVLERTSAWASFTDGERSLLMCDLRAWCPVEFGLLVTDTGHDDQERRAIDAGGDFRKRVCEWRCEVVRDAVMQILAWIEHEGMGPFRPTGSGQSYSAFRRRYLTHKLLVHDDSRRLEAERAAMWTGRCEAWRHGRLTSGPYREYDIRAAYCTIAAECSVPTIARGHVWQPKDARVQRDMLSYAVLARVTVETRVPCIPTRMGDRTAWPVGTFQSWLWDPELQLAYDFADRVTVHEYYAYSREPALRHFATDVLAGLAGTGAGVPPVCRRVLKHWSRCLVGRLGLRYRAWEPFATVNDTDLRLVTYVDSDEGTMTDLLIAGREWMLLSDMRESLESLPQVPSWVMSECRRRLWSAMVWSGLDNVVYVDTDSIIIDAHGAFPDGQVPPVFVNEGWAPKGDYLTMTVNGPRNLQTTLSRKIAGLPLTARQVAPLEFTGEVMRSIKESMKAGQLDCVATLPRTFKMNAVDLRRQHVPGGRTQPFTVSLHVHEDE